MKAIICTVAGHAHISTPGTDRWNRCECGAAAARWDDPQAGMLAVAAPPAARRAVFGLGLNNQLLLPAVTGATSFEVLRALHAKATDAPGFVFDKSRAGCWAVVLRIGGTADTRWADEQETAAALSPATALDAAAGAAAELGVPATREDLAVILAAAAAA